MAQSLMAGGRIGAVFSRSVSWYMCVCKEDMEWSEMDWDGLAVCIICIQSFSEGRLLWRIVYNCVCVCVCICVYIVYKGV